MVRINFLLCLILLCVSLRDAALAQQISAPDPQAGTVVGTVLDVNDGMVPGAIIVLEGRSFSDHQRIVANDTGFFHLDHPELARETLPYVITISANGSADWTSAEVILQPGQYMEVANIRLRIAVTVVTLRCDAVGSTEEMARIQVEVEEKQRVLGFIPNFYVVYDDNAVPLTPALKFRLALEDLNQSRYFPRFCVRSNRRPGGQHPELRAGLGQLWSASGR